MWGTAGLWRLQMSWQYQRWKQMLKWLEDILAELHSGSRSPGTNKLIKMHFGVSDLFDFGKTGSCSLFGIAVGLCSGHTPVHLAESSEVQVEKAAKHCWLAPAPTGEAASQWSSLLTALEGCVTNFSSSCCRQNSCTQGDTSLESWVNNERPLRNSTRPCKPGHQQRNTGW